MKLYCAPSACSLAVHIALREIGATLDSVAVDLARPVTADGANYYGISPRGYVPLLQLDDGSRHTEVASLLQVVADLDPARGQGQARRAVCRARPVAVAAGLAGGKFQRRRCLRLHHRQLGKGPGHPADAVPDLRAYRERVSQRPRVQDALVAEGLVR